MTPFDGRPLRALHRAISDHPAAAQALFAALVAEGRAYAATHEGRALHERLSRSELVHDARAVWSTLVAGRLVEDTDLVLPTAVIEAIARAASCVSPEDAVVRALSPEDDRGE